MAHYIRYLAIALCLLTPLTAHAQIVDTHPSYDKAIESIIKDDVETAISHLRVSAEAGHVDSQFLLALKLSQSGQENEGLKWFKIAAQNGEERSQQVLDLRAQYQ